MGYGACIGNCRELTVLLREAGSNIACFENAFYFVRKSKTRRRVIAVLKKIPALRNLCGDFLLVAMKAREGQSMTGFGRA